MTCSDQWFDRKSGLMRGYLSSCIEAVVDLSCGLYCQALESLPTRSHYHQHNHIGLNQSIHNALP
jgi:hypothetical protein